MPPMFDQAREKELARRLFNELYPENYYDKLSRISASTNNRIMRTDHPSRHETHYVLGLLTPDYVPVFMPVVCKTLNAMEIISSQDPPCPVCTVFRGKKRGFLHLRKKGE